MEDPVIIEVESDFEESGFFDLTTNDSGVDSRASPSLTENRGSNSTPCLSDVTCTNSDVFPRLLHNSRTDLLNNDREKSDTDKNFDIRGYFGEKSAFLDINQQYLKERQSENVHRNEQICQELVSKFDICQDVLQIDWIQFLMFENQSTKVRSTNNFDRVDLRMKIERAELSSEMKLFLNALSKQGLDLLMRANLIDEYAEIQSQREFTTCKGNQEMRVCVTSDLICLTIRSSPWIQDEIKPPDDPDDPDDFPYLKVSSCSTRSKERTNLKNLTHSSTEEFPSDQESKVSIFLLLSLRNSLPTEYVMKQYLLRVMDPVLKTYLLVYHIGPLVDKWKMILYQYRGTIESQLPWLPVSDSRYIETQAEASENESVNVHDLVNIDDKELPAKNTPDKAKFLESNPCKSILKRSVHFSEGVHEGRGLNCVINEALEGVFTEGATLEMANISVAELDIEQEKDEDTSSLRLKKSSQHGYRNTTGSPHEKDGKVSVTDVEHSGGGVPPMEEILHFWEENEGKLTYEVTDLKECLKYNIMPVPTVVNNVQKKQRKKRHNTHK